MSDTMKAIATDMDDYRKLCKRYGETPVVSAGGFAGDVDAYSEHAIGLRAREERERLASRSPKEVRESEVHQKRMERHHARDKFLADLRTEAVLRFKFKRSIRETDLKKVLEYASKEILQFAPLSEVERMYLLAEFFELFFKEVTDGLHASMQKEDKEHPERSVLVGPVS